VESDRYDLRRRGHAARQILAAAAAGQSGTWGSQISNFLYITETDGLVALCDQWWAGAAGRNDLEQSRYIWVPVVLDRRRAGEGNYRWKWDPFLRKSWSWNGDETGTPKPD
jgi:hypothetical protein